MCEALAQIFGARDRSGRRWTVRLRQLVAAGATARKPQPTLAAVAVQPADYSG